VNFYKRFMGDYAKDTSHLSLVEHGAYALLLDAQYAMEKGLPPAYADLYRICRAMTKLEQMTVAKVADEFFPIAADGWRWNARAMRELLEAAPAIEAARINGQRGGRPKKETQQKPSGLPSGFQNDNPAETQQKPRTKASHSHSQNTPSLRSGVERAIALLPDIPAPLIADYLEVRRAKKAGALSATAVQGLQREAGKAGIPIEAALRACCEYAWIGFNAQWYADRQAQVTRRVSGNRHAAAASAFFPTVTPTGEVIDA
jgi:uncharacterized protein YdaU (DUF1376 family)